MNTIFDRCRLCLDPSVEISTTIDSPQLKDQIEKVFCFSIEPKQGYCSGVCQSCSYTISEFYQYSEKVRQNQEILNGNATNCDQTKESKVSLECVKQEPLNDFGLPETIEDAHKPDNEVSEAEEASILDSKISLENGNVQTPSDSEMMEMNQDVCGFIDEVSKAEAEAHILHSEMTLEEFKIEITDSDLSKTIDEEKEIPIPDSNIKFESGKVLTPSESELSKTTEKIIKETQIRKEEDELFKKHISLVCELCGIQTDSYPALCSHFKEEHNERYSYVMCCNKKLIYRCHIREHIEFHLNPDVFRCELCGFRFNRQDSLNRHMLKMHPQTLKCAHCTRRFTEESTLSDHMKLHLDNTKVPCRKCNKLCTKKALSVHMLRKHSEEKPREKQKMRCNICDKEFSTIKYFDQHIKMHIGINVQKFKCKICQIGFKMEKNLNHHMKKKHATDKVQCDQCPRKFKHLRALNSHKLWWHSEPRHQCEYCGQKFKELHKLKEHRAANHTGEVLYTCEFCGISIHSRSARDSHLKRHHVAEVAQKKRMMRKRVDPIEVGLPVKQRVIN